MALTFFPILPLSLLLQILLFGAATAAPQDGQAGYANGRVPVLYEAYYPEPREWSPQASLQEIQRLRELTSQLLREEEELAAAASAAAAEASSQENVFEPRSQILEYVFSRPLGRRPSLVGRLVPASSAVQPSGPGAPAAERDEEEVQVASLTVSDSPHHRTRHHHGEGNWLLRRLAPAAAPPPASRNP